MQRNKQALTLLSRAAGFVLSIDILVIKQPSMAWRDTFGVATSYFGGLDVKDL